VIYVGRSGRKSCLNSDHSYPIKFVVPYRTLKKITIRRTLDSQDAQWAALTCSVMAINRYKMNENIPPTVMALYKL